MIVLLWVKESPIWRIYHTFSVLFSCLNICNVVFFLFEDYNRRRQARLDKNKPKTLDDLLNLVRPDAKHKLTVRIRLWNFCIQRWKSLNFTTTWHGNMLSKVDTVCHKYINCAWWGISSYCLKILRALLSNKIWHYCHLYFELLTTKVEFITEKTTYFLLKRHKRHLENLIREAKQDGSKNL